MLDQLRADTPASARLIHLNNAGASLPPTPVLQVMQDYLSLEAQIGGYEAADAKSAEIDGFYTAFAQLLHTKAQNIAFAASATDAYARALSAIPFKAGDRILTTENDYVSNQIAFLSLEKRLGVEILRARDLEAGGVDVADLESMIKEKHPVLVAVTHVPTNSGLIQPVEAIGKICREHNIWYLVDACQSVGQMPLDVDRIGCDFMTATNRKFLRGPRGAGFLYVSDRVLNTSLELLFPDMRGAHWTGPDMYATVPDAKRFEYHEMHPALVLGSKVAAEYALHIGLDWIENRVSALATHTRALLADIPGVRVLDRGEKLCGIVTAYSDVWEPRRLLQYLQSKNINCRISGLQMAQIDFPRKSVPWALRISPHYYNTEAEIEQTIQAMRMM